MEVILFISATFYITLKANIIDKARNFLNEQYLLIDQAFRNEKQMLCGCDINIRAIENIGRPKNKLHKYFNLPYDFIYDKMTGRFYAKNEI